jgi:hypothetical protein
MQSLTLMLTHTAEYISDQPNAYLSIPAAWWIHPERAMGSSHQSVKPGLWQRPAESQKGNLQLNRSGENFNHWIDAVQREMIVLSRYPAHVVDQPPPSLLI